ncbi:MAG: hypothetical protein WKF73_00895 [Nocardioidaceae bacterium]
MDCDQGTDAVDLEVEEEPASSESGEVGHGPSLGQHELHAASDARVELQAAYTGRE